MARTVQDFMTPNPITLAAGSSLVDAAAAMREADVGDVIVTTDAAARGIVTDRDIVVRAVADGRDPSSVTLGEICSGELVSVGPQDSVDQAVRMMRDHAVRRLPVLDGGRAVGVVSLGDLAIERDPHSALADISAAPPNT